MKQKKFFSQEKIKTTKNKLLKQYNLSCDDKQLGTSGFFDTTKCLDINKNYYILKIRKEKSALTKEKFLKEIAVNRLLSKYQNVNKFITFPKYLNSEIKKFPEWLIYRYIEGCNVGGWYNFDKQKLKKISDKLPEIINTLSQIKKPNFKLSKIKYKEVVAEFAGYKSLLKRFFTLEEIKKGEQIINQHKKLLNSTKLALSHGDLHPANIILTPENQLTVIDWSDVKLDNPAFDATFLWFELWNQKNTQINFYKHIIKNNNKNFETLFLINLIRLTPKMLEIVDDGKTYFEKLKKQNKFSEQDNIDYKILQNAMKYYIFNYRKKLKFLSF